MEIPYRFTDKYKNSMTSKIDSLTEFLRKKTNYDFLIKVKKDKNLGYMFYIEISADDFQTSTILTVENKGRDKIYQKVKQNIPKFNHLNERRISIPRNQKNVKYTALYCSVCEKEKKPDINFHRNTNSPVFAGRGGFCNVCFDCAQTRATQIMKDSDTPTAIMYLCAIYDRPYNKKLINDVLAKDLSQSIFTLFGEYFRRVSLVYKSKNQNRNITFAESDSFKNMEVING